MKGQSGKPSENSPIELSGRNCCRATTRLSAKQRCCCSCAELQCRGKTTLNALQRQEVVLSDKAVERGAVDAELLGRKGQISALFVDRFLEKLFFQLFEGLFPPFAVAADLPVKSSCRQDRLRKVLHGDERPRGIGQGPLHRVLQLPHVTRPAVLRHSLHR